ncbi:MAG: hypothetical protein GKR89_22055 [Candidatus Latescibacteria bacterium]|nr:hypothetical protein [Candidatus Latescibacterota bacterium]
MAPRPMSDHAFTQYLLEGKLMGGQCQECQALYAPPRAICPQCRGTTMAWVQLCGNGRLAAFTSIAVAPPTLQAEGHGRDNPYCTGVVTLDEGPRVVARIEGLNAHEPETVALGTPLAVRFGQRQSDADPQVVLTFAAV